MPAPRAKVWGKGGKARRKQWGGGGGEWLAPNIAAPGLVDHQQPVLPLSVLATVSSVTKYSQP